jgi:flagellar hook-associated protein 1
MQSTFTGIEIGKRSMVSQNEGLLVTGHNLANASTEGYSRQRIELQAAEPIYEPSLNREETPGQIGQGVEVQNIERVRDGVLEQRIVAGKSGEGYWESRDKYTLMLEQIYNEPSDVSARGQMDKFWDSWQELSIHPNEIASRNAVLERGKSLIDTIHARFNNLKSIRDQLDGDVQGTVFQVNDIVKQVAGINEQIAKSKALGDNPNDLLDRRDLLVSKLAKLVDVTTDTRDPDEFTIHSGGLMLVQGRIGRELSLSTSAENDGYSKVVWKESGEEFNPKGGSLGAVLGLRDGDVRDEIRSLDTMTLTFVDLVNDTHRAGYGMNGKTGTDFFTEYPFINNLAGNFDRTGGGNYDSSYIFRITGSNTLKPQEQPGLEGTLTLSGPNGPVNVAYHPTDTVADIVDRINTSKAEVTARIDREGRLALKGTTSDDKANPDFVLRHVEDSGSFLTGYAGILKEGGQPGSFDWGAPDEVLKLRGGGLDYAVAPLSHPAGWIEVNPALMKDPLSVAAGFGENGKPATPGDGSAALAIAGIRTSVAMVDQSATFDDYFANAVARVGLKGEQSDRALQTQQQFMKQLGDLRDSISGVNMDEELSQMIKFQHGYAAAAKFISTMNDMLDTIINKMGV